MLKRSRGEKIFGVFNTVILFALLLLTLYPCLYVLFASFSDPVELYDGSKLLLFPRGFNIINYNYVFKEKLLWTGYANTIIYTVIGTFLCVILTTFAAYGLSRRDLPGKNVMIMLMTFSMYFSGGMIPNFLVVKSLNLLDTRLAMILPGAVNTFNFIIELTYFKGMPYELEEAAKIDGANHFTILFKIMMPLAKASIAVIALYYAVAFWNDYVNALLYINDQKLYPLQLVLREILFQGSMDSQSAANVDQADAVSETIKYATMVVSTVPILCVYPFIQKYFVQGVMIGAVKG